MSLDVQGDILVGTGFVGADGWQPKMVSAGANPTPAGLRLRVWSSWPSGFTLGQFFGVQYVFKISPLNIFSFWFWIWQPVQLSFRDH